MNIRRKLVIKKTQENIEVKVYKNFEGEYEVDIWVDSVKNNNATYFTDDKADALGTADAMLSHGLK